VCNPDSTQQNARRATYAAGERAGSRPATAMMLTALHSKMQSLSERG
jgi:hypothetical protein